MNQQLEAARAVLQSRLQDRIRGSVKLIFEGEGSIVVDADGARIADEPADVTLSARAEVFQGIFDGSLNPAGAFMTRKLKVDGSPMRALKISNLLTG